MQAQITDTRSQGIQLTLDSDAAIAVAASLRFAGKFHDTVRVLSDQIAQLIENAVCAQSR
jgi:hypothetical protein